MNETTKLIVFFVLAVAALGASIYAFMKVAILPTPTKKENYGVFSHYATMVGIKEDTYPYYTFDHLSLSNPNNYWNEEETNPFDIEVKKNLQARFDPQNTR